MTRLIALVCAAVFSLPAPATEITLSAGYQFNADFEVASLADQPPEVAPGTGEPGDDVTLDDSAVFSLAVDFEFQNQANKRVGFFVSHESTQFGDNAGLSNPDIDVTHVHFTGTSYFPRGRLEPFVMAGIGAGFFSPDDSTLEDETKLSAQIGAGTNYRFSDNLLLRMDVRWIPTFFNGSGEALCSGGCTIAVSSETYSQLQANVGLMLRF